MKKSYLIYAAAAAMLLTACTQDLAQDASEAGKDGKIITFSAQTVSVQDETRSVSLPDALPLVGDGLELWLMPSEEDMVSDATRGTQINSVEALNNFGVSAYRHGAIPTEKTLNEYLTDNNLKPDFFYNLEATKITDTQKFKLTKDFFWPTDDDVLSFFAYAPYGDENVELSAATAEGPQSINFKVDTNVKNQVDFITTQASTTSHLNTSATPSVALNFTHQLTGIRFVIGDQFLKGWIKSISLKGVYTQGTYTIGDGWTLDDKKKGNFTISYNLDKPVAGTPGEEVSASDEVFMMIPHTFADNDAATIEVVYNDKYTDYIVSAPLKGQTWKAGKTVTYAITSNSLTTLRIGQIQFATTPEGAPKRIWAAGDKVGMYVVSADGKKLKHKNVPVTFDGANWNIDHTTSEGTIYKLPGESFYFYYPYSTASNGQPTGYPEQCPELKATAPVFFEGVIDYFDYKKDQSTLANHLATDLQVAKAEDDGRASMIKATMLRQVGLARFKFATSKTIPQTLTYTNNANEKKTGSVTIAPSTNFVTNKAYLGNNATYFFFTKANETTTFNSNPSDVNHWLEAVNITLAAGEYTTDVNMVTVQDYRYQWPVTEKIIWEYTKATSNTAASIYTWTIPYNGSYTMECWGAAGGQGYLNGWSDGGRGAYTKGVISLTTSTNSGKLYLYIGGKGNDAVSNPNQNANKIISAGWNGGGTGCVDIDPDDCSGAGGGATDIRTNYNATWNNSTSLNSRIMIAAGGGGGHKSSASQYSEAIDGGTPNATGKMSTWTGEWTANVNQTQGNALGQGFNGTNGGKYHHAPAGGGGGLYGGTSAITNNYGGRAAGGSSFISGATSYGCATKTGYTFSSPSFIKGSSSSCPSMTIGGSPAALGRVNGYARITYYQPK